MPDFYRVYRGQDGNFDEDSVAEMALEDEQVSIPDQDLPPDTIWHYIRRRVSGDCGLESSDSPVCIVRIDSSGDMLGSIPNAPTKLAAEGLAEGKVKLRWRYASLEEEIAPTEFHIYIDSGTGFDFETPDAEIPYRGGGPKAGEFDWTSESLTNGEIYRFCVRSYRTVVVAGYNVADNPELNPDCSGNYFLAGTFNDKPYYRRADGLFFIWAAGEGEENWRWYISNEVQHYDFSWKKSTSNGVVAGTYPGWESEGDAVVSAVLIPKAVESQNTNSVSITADSVGPDAITNLIASVEEI